MLNHISICFLPQHQRKRKCFFRSARAEKGIARHIDASGVVGTLIDNGKLANQIARLAAFVVKKTNFRIYTLRNSDISHFLLLLIIIVIIIIVIVIVIVMIIIIIIIRLREDLKILYSISIEACLLWSFIKIP